MENQTFVPKSAILHSVTASTSSSIDDVVSALETTVPTIPKTVVQHFINTAGLATTDPQIVHLISIASEKFIADIVSEALEHMKTKGTDKSTKENSLLTLNELSIVLKEHGIDVKKPHLLHC